MRYLKLIWAAPIGAVLFLLFVANLMVFSLSFMFGSALSKAIDDILEFIDK